MLKGNTLHLQLEPVCNETAITVVITLLLDWNKSSIMYCITQAKLMLAQRSRSIIRCKLDSIHQSDVTMYLNSAKLITN